MSNRLMNRVAIITGGGSGIGKAIALAFAKEGANVVIADVNEESAKKTASEVKGLKRQALGLKTDVTSRPAVEEMVEITLKKFNRIDILVNNAGVETMNKILNLTEKEWDYVMDVNAKGTFLCTQAVTKEMIKQGKGGKIVNMASMAGKTGFEFIAHYCASKAAVILFTKAAALEFAPYKINVNAICPGSIATPLHKRELGWETKLTGVTEEEIDKHYLQTIPLGRLGQPEDVANVAIFLCSEEASYITGQAINITGGMETH